MALAKELEDEPTLDERMLTVRDVVARTTIAESTLCNWRKRGYGPPYVRLGHRIAYPEKSLNRWLGQQRRLATRRSA